jgi:hypothetical protein
MVSSLLGSCSGNLVDLTSDTNPSDKYNSLSIYLFIYLSSFINICKIGKCNITVVVFNAYATQETKKILDLRIKFLGFGNSTF